MVTITTYLNGSIYDEALPVIDMTTSVVVIVTSRGEVTVQLPQTVSVPVESRTKEAEIDDAAVEEDNQVDCDKTKLFLDDCLIRPVE